MRQINGYEGKYSVTEDGRIYKHAHSTKRGDGIWYFPARWLKLQHDSYGYFRVQLTHPTRGPKNHKIHRLVAEAFISNPRKAGTVNHKNGIKTDNRVENLEWLTNKENVQHGWKLGLIKQEKGEQHPNSKLTETQVRRIRSVDIPSGLSRNKTASKYGVSKGLINAIVARRAWKHI